MSIPGNLDPTMQEALSDIAKATGMTRFEKPAFGESIARQLVVTHASIDNKEVEPMKQEARVVCEIAVTEDMLNGGGSIHGGCSAFLIDVCSTLCLFVFNREMNFVSQSMNIVYHSPAALGERLRIVNTTMTVGARAISARTEIWNQSKHRLVASGVHIKMRPSEAKL
ncbi:4HBT domain-containing protein [Favolaschia claudopus]|uniref:4HBT domain-containing protein n=1 Tax=Favolaschia claudopus TaxID=2862362 RepID=A0AAW0EDB9_9AGAR